MLEKLKIEVDKLHVLLADPQPGLFTWCQFVRERWKNIADLWEPGREGKARPIVVWKFDEAPEQLKALSCFAGDEDWLGIVPKEMMVPDWMDYGSFGCMRIEQVTLDNGDVVCIGAHA